MTADHVRESIIMHLGSDPSHRAVLILTEGEGQALITQLVERYASYETRLTLALPTDLEEATRNLPRKGLLIYVATPLTPEAIGTITLLQDQGALVEWHDSLAPILTPTEDTQPTNAQALAFSLGELSRQVIKDNPITFTLSWSYVGSDGVQRQGSVEYPPT